MVDSKDMKQEDRRILRPNRISVINKLFEGRPTEFSSGRSLTNSSSNHICFALMGATASGKTVIQDGLKRMDLPLFHPEKDTTRPLRSSDENPRRHISPEDFDRRRQNHVYFLNYEVPYAEDHEGHAESVGYGYIHHELERGLVSRDALMTFTFPSTVEYVLDNLGSFGDTPFVPIVVMAPAEMLADRIQWRSCSDEEKHARLKRIVAQHDYYQELLEESGFFVIDNPNPEGLEDIVEVDAEKSDVAIKAIDTAVRKAGRIIKFYDHDSVRGKYVSPRSAHGRLVNMAIKALFGLPNLQELRAALKEGGLRFDEAKCASMQMATGEPYSVGHFFDQVYAEHVGINNGIIAVTLNDYAAKRRGDIKGLIDKFLPGIVVKQDCYTYRFALTDRKPPGMKSNSAPYALEIRVPRDESQE